MEEAGGEPDHRQSDERRRGDTPLGQVREFGELAFLREDEPHDNER